MKMGPALFWGLLLVILGLSLIFRIIFNVDFPLLKVVFSFILIFIGIKMLFGSFGRDWHIHGSDKDVIFSERNINDPGNHNDFNVIFGKGVFDFRDYDLGNSRKKVRVSTVFGATVVKIDKEMPVRIRVESAFAGAELPNGNSAVFGSTSYESQAFNPDRPYLDLKLEVVFGGVEVREY